MTTKRKPNQCTCGGHYTDKWHRWVVLKRGGDSSRLYCLDCRAEWRSRAKYIVLLPDHKKRIRSGLTDQEILEAIKSRQLFRVDVNDARVFSARGRELQVVEREHPEGPQRGRYRFVEICVSGRKKKVALHRLVWMVAHNRVPPPECDIDHIDSQDDDTIGNLRLLDHVANRGRRKDQKQETADDF